MSLFKFHWDCGRSGELTSIFEASAESVEACIGKDVYFGEVLGKHSEIYGVLEADDVTLLTEDGDFIKRAREFGIIPVGLNPIEHVDT